MKTLTIQLPDELYERAARRAAALERALVALVEQLGEGDGEAADEGAAARRAQLGELFRSVRGFRMLPTLLREDLYERGGG